MLVACHSSYRESKRSCVNGFIGTRSRWAQFIVCLFDIDLYLSCLLAKNKYPCQFELYFHFRLWRLRFCQSVITEYSECLYTWTRSINTHFFWAAERENLSTRFTRKYDTNRPAQLHWRQDLNFTYRNLKDCYIQAVNTNGADQTARICRQVYTLKFVVRK